ncbi:MAG: RNA polymerase factor sigma-54 [Flavobacteriaceae bacterium]|nr:RNA polymerase factor sigma-54 [Flavobacteriaceae bacterium]MCY4268084.1 RNA polymerase factor sigma-54 [Flavobacteriaceae bacterium]
MLKQQQKLQQTTRLSPLQIQLMNHIRLNLEELEQAVEMEINENPALERNNYEYSSNSESKNLNQDHVNDSESSIEEKDFNSDSYGLDDDIPHYRVYDKYGAPEEKESIPIAFELSFLQQVMDQIGSLNFKPEQLPIAEFLIGSIDDNGYIRLSDQDIIDTLAFNHNIDISVNDLKPVLKAIQSLDPPGIGARDLRECLLIQLKRKPKKTIDVQHAIDIIEKHFNLYADRRFEKLKTNLKINQDQLVKASNIISNLNPKPGGSSGNSQRTAYVVPDFAVTIEGDEVILSLNQANHPKLKISDSYRRMLQGYLGSQKITKEQKQTMEYIKSKLDKAKTFINLISQRYNTLETTVKAIINHQVEYFLSGDEKKIKPLTLKDIADQVEMDISTISRVTSSKYIDTPYGVKLLKYFFSEGLRTKDGDEISSYNVKSAIKEIIESENKNKPISDITISKMLQAKGYQVARRTVSKYREQMKIPVSRLRKQLEKEKNQA